MPWLAPRKVAEMFPPEAIQLPVGPLEPTVLPASAVNPEGRAAFESICRRGEWRDAIAAYLAALFHLDVQVGRLLTALEESGYAENTVVMLCADHGQHLGEHQQHTLGALVPCAADRGGAGPDRRVGRPGRTGGHLSDTR